MGGLTQAAPKSCGHVRGKKVVSRGEAVARIRAAVDARDESGSNIVIVARTDARQAESLDVSSALLSIVIVVSGNAECCVQGTSLVMTRLSCPVPASAACKILHKTALSISERTL